MGAPDRNDPTFKYQQKLWKEDLQNMIQHFKVLPKQARHNMMSDNNAAKAIPNLLRKNVGPDWVTKIASFVIRIPYSIHRENIL